MDWYCSGKLVKLESSWMAYFAEIAMAVFGKDSALVVFVVGGVVVTVVVVVVVDFVGLSAQMD